MRDDPGDIPISGLGRATLVEALSVARDLPAEALDAAAAAPGRIAAAVLAALERAGTGAELSDRDGNLLFWGIHALAESRDTRLFRPLLRALAQPADAVELLFGDALVGTLPQMAVSTFDGDEPGFRAALLDPALDGMARDGLFLAYAYLAATGRIPPADAQSCLLAFDAERPVGASEGGWYGWEGAVALLGRHELEARVDAARADGRLLEDLSSPEHFAATLAAAEAHPGDLARFEDWGIGPFGSAVDELNVLLGHADDDVGGEPDEPARNPLRSVGRNDPCPCGSGRKFKKCCLPAASGGSSAAVGR